MVGLLIILFMVGVLIMRDDRRGWFIATFGAVYTPLLVLYVWAQIGSPLSWGNLAEAADLGAVISGAIMGMVMFVCMGADRLDWYEPRIKARLSEEVSRWLSLRK